MLPFWILLALIAQFVYALVAIFDKHIVTSKTVLHPFSYAFYVSLLSGLTVLVFFFGYLDLPFGIVAPSFSNLIIPDVALVTLSFVTGLLGYIALVNLYEAFSKADVSDTIPVVASVSAMGTLLLEWLFLGGQYTVDNLIGVFLLILGTIFVSRLRLRKVVIFHTVVSGLFFAMYYALIKHIFDLTNFDTGFLYTRIGLAVAALSIIAIPSYYRRIFRKLKKKRVNKVKASAYVLVLKVFAGIASILTLKAVQLGSVAVVQALAGVQFLFIILFAAIFGPITPVAFGENVTPRDIIHKALAATIIAVGLFFTFL